jgi:endonuclease
VFSSSTRALAFGQRGVDGVERARDAVEAGLLALSQVGARVQHQAGDPQGGAALELVDQGEARVLVHVALRAAQVDQVARVGHERQRRGRRGPGVPAWASAERVDLGGGQRLGAPGVGVLDEHLQRVAAELRGAGEGGRDAAGGGHVGSESGHATAVPSGTLPLLEALHDPRDDELVEFLREHLRAGQALVQVVGTCEVSYVGRAASFADAGDLLVMVKPDGSIQVHRDRGVKPVNWQPRTDDLWVGLDDGQAVLVAERRTPEETLRVVFLEVALAQALHLREEIGFVLRGSEARDAAALAREPDLIEPGLTVLDRELPTDVGGIDLFARDRDGRLVVVELKRAKGTQEAVHQLGRYVRACGASPARRARHPGRARDHQAGAGAADRGGPGVRAGDRLAGARRGGRPAVALLTVAEGAPKACTAAPRQPKTQPYGTGHGGASRSAPAPRSSWRH